MPNKVLTPILATGKIYSGDYSNSPQFRNELPDWSNEKTISFISNKDLCVYYDNQSEIYTKKLKRYHGVFLVDVKKELDRTFTIFSAKCKYLKTNVGGNQVNSIYEGYDSPLNQIQYTKSKSEIQYNVSGLKL